MGATVRPPAPPDDAANQPIRPATVHELTSALKRSAKETEDAPVEEALSDAERRAVRAKARAAILNSLRSLGGEAERRALLAHAEETGGFTARELAAPRPPHTSSPHERHVPYQLSWTLSNLKADGLLRTPRRSVWALAGAAAEPVAPASTPPPSARLAELSAMPYREYLRTPEWRRIRAATLHRANYECALDPTHTAALHVHHRTYDRRGAEQPSDLLVLCEECHRVHHAHHGRPSTKPRRAARLKAKRDAAVKDLVVRACLAGGLLVGLLGMLER
jgi:hypothetical protein